MTVKLADFGLARRLPHDSDVISCDASGAPLFLAPETILEDMIGQPVDMWACGIILFILLAGYPPFWSSNDEKLLLSILQGHYSMPSPYWDNVSDEAKDLVRRLIVVEPSQRLTVSEALNHPWIQMEAQQQAPQRQGPRRNFAAVICGVRECWNSEEWISKTRATEESLRKKFLTEIIRLVFIYRCEYANKRLCHRR